MVSLANVWTGRSSWTRVAMTWLGTPTWVAELAGEGLPTDAFYDAAAALGASAGVATLVRLSLLAAGNEPKPFLLAVPALTAALCASARVPERGPAAAAWCMAAVLLLLALIDLASAAPRFFAARFALGMRASESGR